MMTADVWTRNRLPGRGVTALMKPRPSLMLLAAALAVAVAWPDAPAGAADLALRPARHVPIYKHKRVVLRDYDGTPIRLARFRPTFPVPGGPLHAGLCVTQVVIPMTERRIPYINKGGACCSAASNSHLYPYARNDWPIIALNP